MPEVAFRSDVAVFDIGPIFRFDLSRALEARGFPIHPRQPTRRRPLRYPAPGQERTFSSLSRMG